MVSNNYCPTCEDICQEHEHICTVCGTPLTSPPSSSSIPRTTSTSSPQQHGGEPPLLHRVALHRMENLRENREELLRLQIEQLEALREQLMLAGGTLNNSNRDRALIEAAYDLLGDMNHPPAPGGAGVSGSSRPTSKNYIQKIPRIVIQNHDPRFNNATITFQTPTGARADSSSLPAGNNDSTGTANTCLSSLPAVPADFGFVNNIRIHDACLLVLDHKLLSQQERALEKDFIIYVDRGEITFAQKAIRAERMGAKALIIGNHLSQPWPYTMQDSKNEAACLKIPIVMIKKEDVPFLKERAGTSVGLTVEHQPSDCIICTETIKTGDTCVQLECRHIFHEGCVLPWLDLHNTCPYCRFEMETDDAAYNAARRREQRTHAGSQGASEPAFTDFYG